MNRMFVVAGEASGDLHAANFIERYREEYPEITIEGMGGEELQNVGVHIHFSYQEIALMGFVEVLSKARYLKHKLKEVANSIIHFNPDMVLLVDSSGFNIRLAQKLKEANPNIQIEYYIAPKYWAWGKWRIKKFIKYINKLHCIFPFEVEFFRENGFSNVQYVGNPTVQEIEEHQFQTPQRLKDFGKPIIALLPGSRRQEIKRHLPVMLDLAMQYPKYHFVIAQAPGADIGYYQEFLESETHVSLLDGETWDLLKVSQAAIVCSGTATLETAIIGCPQVVMYKTSWLNYALGKALVKVKYISLVNLILEKEVVKELIQNESSVANLEKHLEAVLSVEDMDVRKLLVKKLEY